jgi:hypothetical protein
MVLFVVITATGCARQSTAGPTTAAIEAPTYTGVLRADHENALDVTSQLALGTLRLEGAADAVTAAQAAQALPLWKTLQDSRSLSLAEQLALARQIEGMLSEAQVSAIAAMQLTAADAQTWLEERGPEAMPGGVMPAGRMGAQGQSAPSASSETDRAAMREQFQNMTEEQRAQMQAQFGQGGGRSAAPNGAPVGGFDAAMNGVSMLLTRAVVTLLTARGGQTAAPVPPAEPQSTSPAEAATSAATATPTAATSTPVARITLVPWSTPEPQVTPTPEATQAATANVTTATPADVQPVAVDVPLSVLPIGGEDGVGALVQKPDTDPGPPLTIEITTNASEPNPLLEGGLIYRVGGFVYNSTDETYQVTAVQVTFFDAGGFRGAFYAFPMTGGHGRPGGEWIAHGAMEAQISCAVLGPGESCPFIAEIAGQNMTSFLVHPDAKVAEWHESVGVTLSDTKITDAGTSYVRIGGVATNPHSYAIKNVVISGVLLDASGQMVSMGTGVVTALEAGASTDFEVYVAKKAYVSYRLNARAEQSVH